MKYIKTFESIKKSDWDDWKGDQELFGKEGTFKEWLKENPQDINETIIECSFTLLDDLEGIQEFKNLEYLDCQNNYIKELPDLSNLTKLNFLHCGKNELTELPDLSNLTNLEELYCFGNKLTELPDLSNLKNLKILNCSHNQLTELPDLFDILDNLENLDFENNKLPYNNLEEYIEWHKQKYPWRWEAKKYNL